MCMSGLYCVNTTKGTTISDGDIYSPTTVIHKYGCACALGSEGVVLKEPGYYKVDLNASATASAATALTVSIYKNGVAVPGATQTVTVGAIGNVIPVNISYLEYVRCCCDDAVLTCVISEQNVTSYNLAFNIAKVG